jgi:predicted amidohydrolase YtcJ
VIAGIETAHRHDRTVAIHCVTRTALALAVAAWGAAGAAPGDRVEHGSVVPPDLASAVAELGLTVVTQPGFVAERGDDYVHDVDPDDLPHLYPCRSLLDAGLTVMGSTDAPYTSPDPWRAVAAAVARRTSSGAVLGAAERLAPRPALELFGHDPLRPGTLRRVAVGQPADLCLLAGPLDAALRALPDVEVVATICRGLVAWSS